ncbi:MAG TPA: two-component sensor histidine kinase [Cyanobacteria bacterium UBA11149]|nr:two-component sensor histidine kinase [Cyanobacteria bacterium UBA11367]HBE60347.1 two-component sensor histidine kinase [Cyanobacteria bacterium UBA11366]HBK66641.1 two-component sensor histidine kinase [Cyanobacteria bacterium UBA11166]HBR75411.1 two-component sensor histidine kinase [Cyanobacteria bacterium UBA11159]HBS71855.1 two-component sensor histidine kinase [Cyanobacteria bacterium UBA11153]HBW89675.1 two-component sensor histidine kinase [Cyanobacteria bacterium UBA11149]HCA9704
MQTKLLNQTRLQLASCYSLVMGGLLSIFGLITYHVLIQAYLYSVDRELQGVAKAFHRNLEHVLLEPDRVPPGLRSMLPDLCLVARPCSEAGIDESHQEMQEIYQNSYYLRFISRSDRLIATSGLRPKGLPLTSTQIAWDTVRDSAGVRYHQISISLHTNNQKTWGYLQIGRSLEEVDRRLAGFQHVLLISVPISALFVGISSWWLAGLAMEPIQRSYRQMQQFTADAAHELRTPLTAIIATTDSALRVQNLTGTELRETLSTVERQASRFLGMVKDLLLLSRLEQNTLFFDAELLCLNDLIIDLIDEFSALAEASNLTLTENIKTSKQLEILADSDQLYRVLSNLLVNAITYTPANGKIILSLSQDRNQAVIQVEDTGTGMSTEELSQIFDRFYRVNKDRSRQSGGSGLGLAIAKAIVEAHNGSLQVQSQLGSGSTFTVRLPLKPSRSFPVKLNVDPPHKYSKENKRDCS